MPSEALTGALFELEQAGHRAFPVALSVDGEKSGVAALSDEVQKFADGKGAAVLGLQNVGKSTLASELQSALAGAKKPVSVLDTPMLLPMHTTGEDNDEESADEDEDVDEDAAFLRRSAKLVWTLMRNQGNMQRAKDPVALGV